MALITLYTKTYCPYSRRAKALLRDKGLEYEDIDVTRDEARFEEMRERSNGGTTVPQVFICGRHIGGCVELERAAAEGLLEEWLAAGDQESASP